MFGYSRFQEFSRTGVSDRRQRGRTSTGESIALEPGLGLRVVRRPGQRPYGCSPVSSTCAALQADKARWRQRPASLSAARPALPPRDDRQTPCARRRPSPALSLAAAHTAIARPRPEAASSNERRPRPGGDPAALLRPSATATVHAACGLIHGDGPTVIPQDRPQRRPSRRRARPSSAANLLPFPSRTALGRAFGPDLVDVPSPHCPAASPGGSPNAIQQRRRPAAFSRYRAFCGLDRHGRPAGDDGHDVGRRPLASPSTPSAVRPPRHGRRSRGRARPSARYLPRRAMSSAADGAPGGSRDSRRPPLPRRCPQTPASVDGAAAKGRHWGMENITAPQQIRTSLTPLNAGDNIEGGTH